MKRQLINDFEEVLQSLEFTFQKLTYITGFIKNEKKNIIGQCINKVVDVYDEIKKIKRENLK